jgi:RNA polymerase sigma-70 factor (sigma-E family)
VELGFDEYVALRGAVLVRFAVMLCGDQHRAEDLTQAVLARACTAWFRIGRMAQPEAYIKRMILREWLTWRRRRSSGEVPMADLPASVGNTIPAPGEPLTTTAVWGALAKLPARQRAVLVLRYYEDLPDERIAALLGCAVGTVRSSASRSLATLRNAEHSAEVVAGERSGHE